MSRDFDHQRFHEEWLGLVQPVDGLVVSIPVLVDAQCMEKLSVSFQQEKLCSHAPEIRDLAAFFADVLDLTPDLFDANPPADLSLHVPEGGQTLAPTLALRTQGASRPDDPTDTPAAIAGRPYTMLVWDLPLALPLDRPESVTGPWEYPPSAKFDRLLRATRVPLGLLTNRREIRLVYAPSRESSGSITFRVDEMASVGGRPILDAFVMLLSAKRFFAVAEDRQLPRLLAESRVRQANVTNALADQVLEALQILLAGFEAAADRDGREILDDAVRRDGDHAYGGLLTVLLRLVFLLYAEDRGLLPVDDEEYAGNLSVLGLFEQLQEDHGAFPDSMSRRFGAWPRLLALFRAIYLGVKHGDLEIPARRGNLFDPHRFPFLEGWAGPSAPIVDPEQRAAVRVPTVDDETVFHVLERLILLEGQRLSYKALDVEQIGSVYEALMGYHVTRTGSRAVCVKPSRVWVELESLLGEKPRTTWLEDEAGFSKSEIKKHKDALDKAKDVETLEAALEPLRVKAIRAVDADRLVLQPGSERRRTSSHYTPRSLSEPIVRKTLDPVLAALGENPSSETILSLKVCDPAMGSGAFLVEACRYLGDQVVAAWTREKKLEKVAAPGEAAENKARRLVAQKCLYGVDKNAFAVDLAKLSLWLVTLAKDQPFTFVDHALRHGDSLVGLDLEQASAFHWKPEKQLSLFQKEIGDAMTQALELRDQILALANHADTREKEVLLKSAERESARATLIADLVVGAFFAEENDKARKAERARRMEIVARYLSGELELESELRELQDELHAKVPAFHWPLEFPEVFHENRKDPLAKDAKLGGWFDAFVGNPPFAGKNGIISGGGEAYLPWLTETYPDTNGNSDLCAFFFRRAHALLGQHGSFGLIATNTIAQGDTRVSGLKAILSRRGEIFNATRSMPWPGDAAVAVSIVHLGVGSVVSSGRPILDGVIALAINSRLRPTPERPDPQPLRANADRAFIGSYVLGMGFVLTPEERDALLKKDRRNAERIYPYIGGEEVNTNPDQSFDRYVINFGDMALEEAEAWPDLLRILREKVKPDRDRDNRAVRREYWWKFAERAPALYEALSSSRSCFVHSRVSKHSCLGRQEGARVFAESLVVFAFDDFARFAVLQSRTHELWARLLSSSLEDRLRYSVTDCFETFPFPADLAALETAGQVLHDTRAKLMIANNQGLTATYNRLKDPSESDAAILSLRALHEDLDARVLASYGWSDIVVPPYFATTEDAAFQRFSDAVLDRLFALNAERAQQEKLAGAALEKGKPKPPPKAKPPTSDDQDSLFSQAAPRKGRS